MPAAHRIKVSPRAGPHPRCLSVTMHDLRGHHIGTRSDTPDDTYPHSLLFDLQTCSRVDYTFHGPSGYEQECNSPGSFYSRILLPASYGYQAKSAETQTQNLDENQKTVVGSILG